MNPARLPFARELFAQWQRARGGRTEPATRPFSRGWEELLEDAGLLSATERAEAERETRALAAEGWVELKPVRYKPHLLERISIPLADEERWRAAFGFVPPSDDEARCIREFPWHARLAFLSEARLNISFTELRQLHEFLATDATKRDLVPIKERSLQIFGDEKRLDALLTSALFRPERLDLERDLRCEVVGEPLPWKRGPAGTGHQPILVLENTATWHSYCRWNVEQKQFSAVVYGCGNRFVDGVSSLADIFAELGGARRTLYFGDLDRRGLEIPQEASRRAIGFGLPAIEPHLWSYLHLLALGEERSQQWDEEPPSADLCNWLAALAAPAYELFSKRLRLAQEHVGWEFLHKQSLDAGSHAPSLQQDSNDI